MTPGERSTLTASIRTVLDWIGQRRPGPVKAQWFTDPRALFVLDLTFPDMELTIEERRFFDQVRRGFSIDGNLPATLRGLEAARQSIRSMGGSVVMAPLDERGMDLKVAIPGGKDPSERIDLVTNQIRARLKAPPETGERDAQ